MAIITATSTWGDCTSTALAVYCRFSCGYYDGCTALPLTKQEWLEQERERIEEERVGSLRAIDMD